MALYTDAVYKTCTNQGVDEHVFVTELCLEERVLLAEFLHLLFELG